MWYFYCLIFVLFNINVYYLYVVILILNSELFYINFYFKVVFIDIIN